MQKFKKETVRIKKNKYFQDTFKTYFVPKLKI